MRRLLAIIDAYKDPHGQPSDASVACAIGVSPQPIDVCGPGTRQRPSSGTPHQ